MTESLPAWGNISRVGLFDSGVGGLSVLRSLILRSQSADKHFVYIGDTLRCPYGDRPGREVVTYVTQLSSWLVQQEIDLLVMSCNTSTAVAKNELQALSPVPVVDLISHTANYIARTDLQRVGVIATSATAKKRAFTQAIRTAKRSVDVTEVGCPLLVPVVEAGLSSEKEARDALLPYVNQLLSKRVQAIVYGCTHYPFLGSALENLLDAVSPEPIQIIDPAEILAATLMGQAVPISEVGPADFARCRFVTTGDAETFKRVGSRCLGQDLGYVNNITVNELQVAVDRLRTRDLPGKVIHLSPGAVS